MKMSDKGGGGMSQFSDMLFQGGKRGGGVWTPPFFADIIWEQPLIGGSFFPSVAGSLTSPGSLDPNILQICGPYTIPKDNLYANKLGINLNLDLFWWKQEYN